MATGRELVDACKKHIVATMRSLPECAPKTGKGLGYRAIEQAADMDLDLDGQNGWMTWSLLIALSEDGLTEVVPGTEKRRRYRSTS